VSRSPCWPSDQGLRRRAQEVSRVQHLASTATSWSTSSTAHIGFAADTPNGLVVPVLRDADKKGILQISPGNDRAVQGRREGKAGARRHDGGCFSISSLGGIGGRLFFTHHQRPEVAILGVSKSFMEPVWNGKEFEPRLTLPMSLSYDHRVIDGALLHASMPIWDRSWAISARVLL